MTTTHSPICLASASPRRRELLGQIGVSHDVLLVPPAPGEDEPRQPNEAPIAYVARTALEKAHRAIAWARTTGDPMLGKTRVLLTADTTVALGDDILGKPADAEQAAGMLAKLSGNTHIVHTAVVVMAANCVLEALSTTEVRFSVLSEAEIQAYIATGEPFGKAGAYGIQGHAARFISQISGSYSGVMGLPLFETGRLLDEANRLIRLYHEQ